MHVWCGERSLIFIQSHNGKKNNQSTFNNSITYFVVGPASSAALARRNRASMVLRGDGSMN